MSFLIAYNKQINNIKRFSNEKREDFNGFIVVILNNIIIFDTNKNKLWKQKKHTGKKTTIRDILAEKI